MMDNTAKHWNQLWSPSRGSAEKTSVKPLSIGVIYPSFYDLEMMAESIESIEAVVDFICIVHQKVSFSGVPEDTENTTILNRLNHHPKVEIIYHSGKENMKGEGMLEKMNIGLNACKDVGCDFVLAFAADERMNARELRADVKRMQDERLDTLYYKLQTYYHDEQHYFMDTYYIPALYRINDRKYGRNTASLLCDPLVRMKEGRYAISNHHIHHYSFLKESYANKLNKSIRATYDKRTARQMEEIQNHLQNWQPGQKALVFQNDMKQNGKVVLADIKLEQKRLNRIALCVPFYKRHEITAFVFNHYKELKQKLSKEMELILVAVGSEGKESRKLAEGAGFHYTEYPNNPVSEKHNETYRQAKQFNPDACLKIDSDNIITEEVFRYYNRMVNWGYDYTGLLDCYFMFSNSLTYLKGYEDRRAGETVGVGRFVSRNLLEKLNWKILADKRDNLFDGVMHSRILEQKDVIQHAVTCKDVGGYCIDFKTPFQLTESIVNPEIYTSIEPNTIMDISSIEQYLLPCPVGAISIVIPTMKKSAQMLQQMLPVYQACKGVGEIVLIDNAPETAMPYPDCSKLHVHSRGKNIYVNPAWNWGIELSKGTVVAIINDDIVISPEHWKSLLKRAMEELKPGMVIGVGEECFHRGAKTIRFKPIQKRNWGWGVCMFLYKESYQTIPEDLLIWCGDDYLMNKNTAYAFTGIHIQTPMSATIKATGTRTLAEKDLQVYQQKYGG